MISKLSGNLVQVSLLLLLPILCGACSPFYVIEAAYHQTKILASREKIDDVIKSPNTSDQEREKLKIVIEAREFGISLGLDPKDSFTQYAKVDGEAVSWVVSASPKDTFELFTWWFPFVGSLPYKGFFSRKDAEKTASRLERKGFETWVRGASAFSTLGWFKDPILSSTLRHGPIHIVNTVLHESVHTTLWISGHVAFNESLANFIGHQGAIEFFTKKLSDCIAGKTSSIYSNTDRDTCRQEELNLSHSKEAWTQELDLSNALLLLYDSLRDLYQSGQDLELKLEDRERLFSKYVEPVRIKYPNLSILQSINNAEILQLVLYLKNLEDFHRLFNSLGGDWKTFLERMRALQFKVKKDSSFDPFTIFQSHMANLIH